MSLVKRSEDLFPKFVTDLFNRDFFARPSLLDFDGGLLADMPSANIIENHKDYRIELAAPGFTKKDFKIETDNHILTISSEKKKRKRKKKKIIGEENSLMKGSTVLFNYLTIQHQKRLRLIMKMVS